jgi:ribosomal protein S25
VAEAAQRRWQRVVALVESVYQRNPKLLSRFQSVKAVRLEDRLKCPVGVLHVWLRQLERQERVTQAVQRRMAMKAGSLLKFLVPREGAAPRERRGVDKNAVFDRGRV